MSYSRTNNISISYRHTDVNYATGTKSIGGTITVVMSTSGNSVPKWYSVIKSGGAASSIYQRRSMMNERSSKLYPYAVTAVTTLKDSPTNTRVTESSAGTILPSLPVEGSLNYSNTANQALTKFYKRLAAQQTQFHGMQFLGELHETIKLFKHPFRTAKTLVDKYMDTVRKNALRYQPRRSLPGRRKFEKAIADSWLETAFGLRPLVSDVVDAAKAAHKFAYEDSKHRDRISADVEVPISGSDQTFPLTTATQFINLAINEVATVTQSVRFLAAVDSERSAAPARSFERAMELAGFRLDLWTPTLYELAPWSFLLDYFTNVGTIIETGCQSTAAVKWVQRTDRTSSSISGQVSAFHNDPSFKNTISVSPGRYEIVRTSFFRTPLGSVVPTVSFQLSLPGTAGKYLNMVALWRSKVKDV